MIRSFTILMAAVLLCLPAVAGAAAPPSSVEAAAPANDNGRHILVKWKAPAGAGGHVVYRSATKAGGFKELAKVDKGTSQHTDDVEPGSAWWYRVGPAGSTVRSAAVGPAIPVGAWIHTGRLNLLLCLAVLFGLAFLLLGLARRSPEDMYIRRIAGVDAIEEAVGRATEMGRPIIFVPGIEELQNIQTIAALQILGPVSEMVARYSSEIIVACRIPLVREIGEEVVKQGFYKAGRPDAHKPENVRFVSPEQFDFCAGTNGIILREKPAANLYLGRFFAESLILAETGFLNRAIQIGGTAEVAQLPFFIAACDYTLIGEELFAVSAYMSRDPALLATIKASDWAKILILIALGVGVLLSSLGHPEFANLFLPGTE